MCLASTPDKAACTQSTWVGGGEVVLWRGQQIKMEIATWRGW